MRPIPVAGLALLFAGCPAYAEDCGPLSDKVVAATKAEIDHRQPDFLTFKAGPDLSLTLSCGGPLPSSVGAQHHGETPPDSFFTLFGQAGEAVTDVKADTLADAAREARGKAERLRHSNVEAGGALVTCSFTRSDKGALTMCAVIEKDDRS